MVINDSFIASGEVNDSFMTSQASPRRQPAPGART